MESLRCAQEALGIPAKLVDMLIEGEGGCSVSGQQNKDHEDGELVDFLKNQIMKERDSLLYPDKREYLLVGENAKHERLYASVSPNETRIARNIRT